MIIGIFGGGQLGMMMAEAAKELGHTTIGLDPNPNCPLNFVANDIIVSPYDNFQAFKELASICDVITYEFENVNLELVDNFSKIIPQKSDGLRFSKDRLIEKDFARKLGIPTAEFKEYKNKNDLFFPSIIKTTTGGYDGKGQFRVNSTADIDHFDMKPQFRYIIEGLVEFDYEISVVATRDSFGKVVTYPISKNIHRDGILFLSEAFDDIHESITSKAINFTKKIVTELDYVGTLAVEYFVKGNDVIFNEFAPRPHNSGHYTIEGCNISQFKNHILAITGERIEQPYLIKPTIMVNVLGQDMSFKDNCMHEEVYVHMYHKDEVKPNRKMGHITVQSNSKKNVIKIMNDIIRSK